MTVLVSLLMWLDCGELQEPAVGKNADQVVEIIAYHPASLVKNCSFPVCQFPIGVGMLTEGRMSAGLGMIGGTVGDN